MITEGTFKRGQKSVEVDNGLLGLEVGMVSVHSGVFRRQFVGELERILTEGYVSENNVFQIY